MSYGLYISAAGAETQSRRLETLTHNLVNADTPGFKRELAILQAHHSQAVERGEKKAGTGAVEDVGGGVWFRETVTAFAPGPLRRTDIPTDMAIEGDKGFFVVEKDGRQLLTRAGNFRFASDGRLLTQQGYPVLGEGGEPVAINPTLPWRIDEKGVFWQGGSAVTALALAQPPSLRDLAHAGENLFSPRTSTSAVPPAERRVVSGHLEQSTVKPISEMMELIEASRAYEANVKLIQNQDYVLGSLVNRILRPS